MNEFSSFSPEHRSEGSAETEKAETSSKELGIRKEMILMRFFKK